MKSTFENLNARIIDMLGKYEYKRGEHYDATEDGVNAILDEWRQAKSTPVFNGKSILEAFESSPYYDGDGKIVLNEKHYRRPDPVIIAEFGSLIVGKMRDSNKANDTRDGKYKVGDYVRIADEATCRAIGNFTGGFTSDMGAYCGSVQKVRRCNPYSSCLFSYNFEDIEFFWDERALTLVDSEGNPIEETEAEPKEPAHIFTDNEQYFFRRRLAEYPQYLGDEYLNEVNEIFPFVKAHAGQKTSRVVNKICRHYGFDKNEEGNADCVYNLKYTRFADAINPIAVPRWTILSINPIDFFLMSNGHNWKSCHFIHKTYRDALGETSYGGCYSGGTLSYMLDSTSFVMYTVDNSYKGTHYELEEKINRQMFHIGEDKLIQGRLYPQDNDTGAADLYRNFRDIAQRTIAQCFGVNNLWTNKKGTSICEDVIDSEGVHYRDYESFSNCNVSFLNRGDGEKNYTRITVGANPICPVCGGEHENQECILCEDCYGGRYRCAECGGSVDEDEAIWYEGNCYCCSSCAESAGLVRCDDGEWRSREASDVMWDDYEQEWMYDTRSYWDNRVETYEGNTYTCPENAEEDGNVICADDGEWHLEDNCVQCEDCGRWFYDETELNDDGLCSDCRERLEIRGTLAG